MSALLLCINFIHLHAQKWVDTAYSFTKTTATYGNVVDFAGNNRSLNMDICVPNNDAPPDCGRPLLIAIHGGAFMSGSKDDADIQRWMKDFAKRGYVTAAINYRLGMFQTSANVHCNVTQLFNTPWDCSNMADTAEWYRGCYRGIQDAKGALRYLISNKAQYKIDPRNVFLAGESAGGFIAMGAAFLDTITEKPFQCGAISSVSAPNNIYESTCVQQFKWDTSISSMQLYRPDLGSIEGSLHLNSGNYSIKGVANFFGAMFPGWLNDNTYAKPPSIYLFHQPNDIIVPYRKGKVLKGYSDCFTGLGCSQIINLPFVDGSASIRNNIISLKSNSKKAPDYWLDSTTNNADCATQAVNPALTGHAIDNFWLRTIHMAQYFAPLIDTSTSCSLSVKNLLKDFSDIGIFPNPFQDEITIAKGNSTIKHIKILDMTGRELPVQLQETGSTNEIKLLIKSDLNQGLYFIQITGVNDITMIKKLIKI